MVATILDGRMLSKKIRTNVSEKVSLLKQEGITPKLVVILVGEDPASQVYVRNKRKTAHALGIEAVDIRLPENVEEDELIRLIDELNSDRTVHGILVQLPLPKHINENKVTHRIIPRKRCRWISSFKYRKTIYEYTWTITLYRQGGSA